MYIWCTLCFVRWFYSRVQVTDCRYTERNYIILYFKINDFDWDGAALLSDKKFHRLLRKIPRVLDSRSPVAHALYRAVVTCLKSAQNVLIDWAALLCNRTWMTTNAATPVLSDMCLEDKDDISYRYELSDSTIYGIMSWKRKSRIFSFIMKY
jgi:hypothetical protein